MERHDCSYIFVIEDKTDTLKRIKAGSARWPIQHLSLLPAILNPPLRQYLKSMWWRGEWAVYAFRGYRGRWSAGQWTRFSNCSAQDYGNHGGGVPIFLL